MKRVYEIVTERPASGGPVAPGGNYDDQRAGLELRLQNAVTALFQQPESIGQPLRYHLGRAAELLELELAEGRV